VLGSELDDLRHGCVQAVMPQIQGELPEGTCGAGELIVAGALGPQGEVDVADPAAWPTKSAKRCAAATPETSSEQEQPAAQDGATGPPDLLGERWSALVVFGGLGIYRASGLVSGAGVVLRRRRWCRWVWWCRACLRLDGRLSRERAVGCRGELQVPAGVE
jgi:hypothetical protein